MAGGEEAEVEFIDYLSVLLWKRKAMIVWLVCLSVAATALVSSLMKPRYQVSRVLKIGKIGQIGYGEAQVIGIDQIGEGRGVPSQERHLIDTEEAVIETITDQRLLEEVRAKITPGVPIEKFAKRITVHTKASPQTQSSGHVRYTVQGETPAQAVAVADAIADGIIRRHLKIFEEGMTIKERYEEELEAKVDLLTKEIQAMRRSFDGMRAHPRIDAAAVILLQVNLEHRERRLAGLGRELRDVQLNNSPLMSENTRVIAADAIPSKPIKPRITLNMALAGALSLSAGIFLAFFIEYWKRITGEREKRARPSAT